MIFDYLFRSESAGSGKGSVRDTEKKRQSLKTDNPGKPDIKKQKEGGTLIEKEVSQTGSVGWGVYFYYFKNLGLLGSMTVLISQCIFQVYHPNCDIFL